MLKSVIRLAALAAALCCAIASAQQIKMTGPGISCAGSCAVGQSVVTVTTTTLPGATVGVPYLQTLTPVGGTPPYTFSLLSGSLPGGGTPATFANIDDTLSGWSLCIVGTCSGGGTPGGSGIPTSQTETINVPSPSLDGASMGISMVAPSSTSGTNLLWTKKVGANDAALSLFFDVHVNIPANKALVGQFEFDQFIFRTSDNTEYMFGTQCNQASGKWDVFNQATGAWVPTSATCSLSVGWHEIRQDVHRVAGDTSSCAGHPCMFYDALIVDGVAQSGFATVQPAGALPVGFTSNVGFQMQFNILPAGSGGATVSEFLDEATFGYNTGGLVLTQSGPSAGQIAGTALTVGNAAFTVQATDSRGVPSNPRPLSIAIGGGSALTINNTSFPGATFGSPYSQPISVNGGTGFGYSCSISGGALPPGLTLPSCASGVTATSATCSVGTTYNFKITATDSGSNTVTAPASGNFSILCISAGGPPNFAGARAEANDSCILNIPINAGWLPNFAVPSINYRIVANGFAQQVTSVTGDSKTGATLPLFSSTVNGATTDNHVTWTNEGSASTPGCPLTDSAIPNLGNGSTLGMNTSAVDPQMNNLLMTRVTDGQLGGVITSGTFLNRPYVVGEGGSGDTNITDFPTAGSSKLVTVIDSGNRHIILSMDEVAHTFAPILTASGALWLPGSGEFSGSVPLTYHAFESPEDTVNKFVVTCTNPGHPGGCTAPTTSTIEADFNTVFPGNFSAAWSASHAYSLGNYVQTYMTNSQSAAITQLSCTGGVESVTVGAALLALNTGQLATISGFISLYTSYNAAAQTITANGPNTIFTFNNGCSTLAAVNVVGFRGVITMGSNVLFQQTSNSCISGASTPAWDSTALVTIPDNTCNWVDVGTTNFDQGGGWSTQGGVSVDDKRFSEGFSNNNFDKNASGTISGPKTGTAVKMSGNQNTGFYVYQYNASLDLYYEWNMGTGIGTTYSCATLSGPQCPRQVTGTPATIVFTPACAGGACRQYLHNVKTLKGGTFVTVGPEYCGSTTGSIGTCTSTSKFFWQPGLATMGVATDDDAGHQTERFTHYQNFNNGGSTIATTRAVTDPNNTATMWSNSNISYNFDGHWGSYYLNGSVSDATVTPIGGCTSNTYDFPYSSPYESECLIVPMCGVAGFTPNCSLVELQNSHVAREAHCWQTGASNTFNTQYCISGFSQDGKVIFASTDYACQLGGTDGSSVPFCGFVWSANFPYFAGQMIQPTWPASFKTSNSGGFTYTTTGPCTSGAIQPTTFNQTIGGTTLDGTCTWITGPVGNGRGDVIAIWTK